MRFPAEDGGRSLAEMAQRDLSATLQLLAERAQYITGATGAAIALRDSEEMVCRASAGGSAPEVGAQLQVNSGLSGESVRTRQTLRCDDALTDERVNRESCEALGIRSVVVMPLLQGDEVIGVFELFSDKPGVFETRDITALERMGSMVHTALEQSAAALGVAVESRRELEPPASAGVATDNRTPSGTGTREAELEPGARIAGVSSGGIQSPETVAAAVPIERIEEAAASQLGSSTGIVFHKRVPAPVAPVPVAPAEAVQANVLAETAPVENAAEITALGPTPEEAIAARLPEEPTRQKGPVVNASSAPASDEVDVLEIPEIPTATVVQDAAAGDVLEEGITHTQPVNVTATSPADEASPAEQPAKPVPVASRGAVAQLRKCQACGFPVSEGRQLCLDCEKKGTKVAKAVEATAPSTVPAAPPSWVTATLSAEEPSVDAPRFMGGEEEVSWLASHKLMVIAMAIAVVVIVVLMLAR